MSDQQAFPLRTRLSSANLEKAYNQLKRLRELVNQAESTAVSRDLLANLKKETARAGKAQETTE